MIGGTPHAGTPRNWSSDAFLRALRTRRRRHLWGHAKRCSVSLRYVFISFPVSKFKFEYYKCLRANRTCWHRSFI